MCGIAGIIENKGKEVSKANLKRMTDSVAHRGPDDEGVFLNGNIGLGHRRLSIIDVSSAGHQPMPNKDRTLWITFNGEIYNYIELKKKLGGKYQTSTDTEVILAYYEKWGADCVKKFNGIFAFAIWDDNKKILFCARDHLGVKPFYYMHKNGVFYFASEIKAILAVVKSKIEPNDSIIYDYLAYGYYHHSNQTFFKDICQIPAGHTLILKNRNIKIENYWNLPEKIINRKNTGGQDVAEEFAEILKNSVKIQLRSDVPVGMQLSGGLDSSLVVSMANKITGGQKNFRLFSFVYGKHKDIEKPYMEALAKRIGWDLEFFEILPSDLQNYMGSMVKSQDEPFPGLPTLGLHVLAEFSRKNKIPVILGGQGGDEIGAGYEYYMGAYLLDVAQRHGPDTATAELISYENLHSFKKNDHSKFLLNTVNSYLASGTSQDGTSFAKPEILNKDFASRSAGPRFLFPAPFNSHLQNMQYRDIFHTKLPRVLHSADRAAMAYGVEQRVPLIDYRLVELGLGAPAFQKIRNGVQRFFMRKAAQKILPLYVRNAPKRSVPSPQRNWFKTELRPWVLSVFSSKLLKEHGYLDQEKVLEEYRRYCQTPGVPPNSFHIWQWLHLEHWLKEYFD
ncbi:MAG: asparagine synthase (glutamine-hydrolyzing) [Candidatus Yanofskybacteria bacterium RIFCSPHIGHO2_02_FULL_41_11]|uniref:asparagine synthase (glutamine-hydrolyzing) n=1 Tax=Candidatus Yanofskybacteria bacterium RIFCSPHIGHO2_02_FULL_41_11 TaxID=1802675 RepID=A0A1F8FBS8_9BACT|nr:MAG: asparagine synthase (glutamine-hydrolyzing) [Candidatus Yanofskybacteria bacterium RIFCSPHIGHO2_02_FULL_41_11]